jgi:hypothetical protein
MVGIRFIEPVSGRINPTPTANDYSLFTNDYKKEKKTMIDLTINEEQLKRTIERAREKNIIIPTFEQMKNPELIPEEIKSKLKNIGLWDINSYNLFRITWKNEAVKKGGLFDGVNFVELPSELTGVKARIFALMVSYRISQSGSYLWLFSPPLGYRTV